MYVRWLLRTAAVIALASGSPASFAADSDPVTPESATTSAADSAATEPDGGVRTQPWGAVPGDTLKLSLHEAIAQGLENNLGVQVQRFGPLVAAEDVSIALGAYDPIWESEIGWDEQRYPNANRLNSNSLAVSKTLDGSGGFVGLLPLLGTEYSAKLASQRVTTNSTFQSLSPEYRSATIFSLRQPLLRGLIWNRPWTRVKVSRIAHASSLESFRLELMDTVARIEDAYWLLIARYEDLRIARKSLETSKALLEQTRTQYDVGVISRVEVTEAEAGVADREFREILAKNIYRLSQDNLIVLVLGEQLVPDTTLAIEPTDRAQDYVSYDIDVDEATRVAFQNRPEVILAIQNIDRLEIEEQFAKHERLPQFDVIGAYAYQGLSGRQNEDNNPCAFSADELCDPVALAAPYMSYGDSYDNFYASNGANNWTVRGVFSIPIPNTSARHRATQAGIQLRQARTQKRRIELDIVLQVRTAARNIVSSQEGIEAAERRVAASAEQLRAEEIRLEYGESTPFDVLLREEDVVEAEAQKVGAYLGYRTSLTALDREQGTILRNRNILIDDALTLR